MDLTLLTFVFVFLLFYGYVVSRLTEIRILQKIKKPRNSETEFLIQVLDSRAHDIFDSRLDGDAGFDLEVWSPDSDFIDIPPKGFVKLPTGIKLKVGDNAWGCIRPRSSTFWKRRLIVQEGTIDSGYTGDLFIIVYNPNDEIRRVQNGDRLAQIIPIPKFDTVGVRRVSSMPITSRGSRGFGSTGGIK